MITSDLLIYKANKGQDVIVNDKTSFSSSYIDRAKALISPLKTLELLPSVFVFPSNYQEDYVQASRRTNFKFSEWMIAAITVDNDDQLINALLLSKNHIREGLVLDLRISKITDLFYRGFAIQEMEDADLVEDEIFLESLGCDSAENDYVYYSLENSPNFDDDDVEEIQDIVIQMPEFEANSKRKIINLGNAKEAIEVEETEEALIIEVEKPQFESNHKGKVKNLGFSGEPRKKEVDIKQPSHIDIEMPAFEPTRSGKVTNLGSYRKETKKKVVLENVKTPEVAPVELSSFEPSSKAKIINYDQIIKEEKKDWKTIDLYKIKPNVYHGERSIISCKMFEKEKYIFDKIKDLLVSKKSLLVDDNCVFVGVDKDNIMAYVEPLKHFNISAHTIVLCVVDSQDNILDILITSIEDSNISYVISCRDDFSVTVISKSGVSLDDRALPYFTFDQLMEMVKNG